MELFLNRRDAGQKLGEKLMRLSNRDTIVLALPRGGVPVAYEVAKMLKTPLDIFIVRKLGVPWNEELAMGAIATGDVRIINDEIIKHLHINKEIVEQITGKEKIELRRRESLYRGNRPFLKLENKTVVIIDDGLATGASMKAAVMAVQARHPSKVIVGVPVSAESTRIELKSWVDEIVCVATPEPFTGVGRWYRDFSQTTDEEVRELLEKSPKLTSV